MSQKETVLNYLSSGRGITNFKALNLFSIVRLSAHIHALRGDGHFIRSVWRKSFTGKRYTEYFLVGA